MYITNYTVTVQIVYIIVLGMESMRGGGDITDRDLVIFDVIGTPEQGSNERRCLSKCKPIRPMCTAN